MDYAKADIATRFIAALIDGVIQWVVSFIPFIGALIGAAYMLVKDGLFEGQSLGKKVMKLQVVELSGKKADFMVSIKRNAIFAIPSLIAIIPIIGWIIGGILSLIVAIIEIVTVLNDPKGRRMGDKWANSQVIAQK
ncbi:MAG TPA: RDD family protein [Clostridiales bacterium]|nr:RDD family protein [Clostridiales bacterium]